MTPGKVAGILCEPSQQRPNQFFVREPVQAAFALDFWLATLEIFSAHGCGAYAKRLR
jgi:hypothetical protein